MWVLLAITSKKYFRLGLSLCPFIALIMNEERATTGGDLIVGFGNRRRPIEEIGNENVAAMEMLEKQVRFSDEEVAVVCFQYPSSEEVSTRWYSKKDKYAFEQEMVREVQSIRRGLSTTPLEEVPGWILYACVGLEALITKRVMRFVKEKRHWHSRSIVEMQAYLREDQLAEYAENSSFESRERAQKLAAGYAKMLSPTNGA